MTNSLKPIFLTAFLLIPAVAHAQINVGDKLGLTLTGIQTALESQGFVATEFEIEDSEIEVEATNAGKLFEIEISSETGLVLAVDEDDNAGEEYEDDDDD